jgi:hypothetical protein
MAIDMFDSVPMHVYCVFVSGVIYPLVHTISSQVGRAGYI